MFLTVGNALWSLLSQSDMMTKAILLLLLATSIISWTLIFYKLIITKIKKKHIATLESQLSETMVFADYSKIIAENKKNYVSYLLHKEIQQGSLFLKNGESRQYEDLDYIMFDEQVGYLVEEYNTLEWQYLSFLAMVSSTAPFVGLLGTVWGLTHSFISISERQMADIVTIAPGIAEAFLTTLAGLVVAIPALVMYHYFKTQAEDITARLDAIAQQAKRIIYKTYLSHKGT